MSDNGFLDTISSDFDENEPKMVLYIETLTGTAFEMMVSPLDSVLSIKNKIQHDEGIPINQQHLLLGDKELSNSAYLEEEGITGGCTLRLILGMRGGPISTRRATSRNEHLLWREIRDVVEATRDDMMTKVPPGSKITLLVYREGHTINLLKVIENNDGSYSALSSDTRKSTSGRSRFSVRNDVDVQNERLRENTLTMTKLCELREKMEELNLRKRNKNQKSTESPPPNSHQPPQELSPIASPSKGATFTPLSHTSKKTEKQYKIKKYQSALAHLDSNSSEKSKSFSKNKVKQWLNSDYYDDPSMVPQKKPSRKVKQSDEEATKRHMFVNKILFESDSSLEAFDEDDLYRNKKYKVKLPSQIKRNLKSSKHFDERMGATSTLVGDEASNEGATVVQSRNDNISIGDKTSKILAEYYPDMSRSEFRQSIAHRKPLHDEASNHSGSGELPSSIAILEEEPEANVGNDEPDFTPPSGPISVPSPDANTFTISQIPREHVSTATGSGSARNRIRVARLLIKDDERPKTSPHKFGRKVCEFLLNETDEGSSCGYVGAMSDSKSNKLRFKRTKCISISNLDKLTNSKVTSINAVCSWPRISSSKTKLNNDKLKITKMENPFPRELESRNSHKRLTLSGIHNKGFIENIETKRPYTNALQIDTYDCKSKVDEFKSFSKITDNQSIMIRSDSNYTNSPSTSTIEPLPPIETKKPPRTRCKKCNKRLNITTIHTCRCGENFCSQHRYSEVHGCRYDYKTEGRKLIEQANPLVLAPKLPKI